MGGLAGGIHAQVNGKNFWNGASKTPSIKYNSEVSEVVDNNGDLSFSVEKSPELRFSNGQKQDLKWV